MAVGVRLPSSDRVLVDVSAAANLLGISSTALRRFARQAKLDVVHYFTAERSR
jgi:hypothetical protein